MGKLGKMVSTKIGRIPISKVWPVVDAGKFPAKAFESEVIEFGAVAFREGHDRIATELILTSPKGKTTVYPLNPGHYGTDTWSIKLPLREIGIWTFQISAWDDAFATWKHNTEVKLAAGVDQELMMQEGVRLLERFAAGAEKKIQTQFAKYGAVLSDNSLTPNERFKKVLGDGLELLAIENPLRELETRSEQYQVLCERALAGNAAWYEFFPRSEGAKKNPDGSWVSGNFKTAIDSLDRVSEMGFDVLYLPPVHPIGKSHRKGPNNSLNAGPHDPGSPWAIGSIDGGHDTIHPDLGSEKDFANFVKAANKKGIEVAMDLALQASPDHPWVKTNPKWFTTRADGSIAYAENPPKKYQDIYPINFDNDPEGIFQEVLRVVNKWVGLGVKIFRVDNPHTKPVAFWERLIAAVNQINPEVIFLAEAFTRPAMMHTLGKAGFQQSYTYFTWRNTKDELAAYLHEVSQDSANFFRPNFWVNTPDILTEFLQFGGKPAFKIRATLAAMATPLWGMYAGFELYESVARPGSEENIDNEKYEYKARDFAGALKQNASLAPRIALLNKIRKENYALQQLRNLRVHYSDDQSILVFSKHISANHAPNGKANTILVVVNCDPHSARETTIHLRLDELDVPASFKVKDLITGNSYNWGEHNFVRLDAFTEPAHIMRIER